MAAYLVQTELARPTRTNTPPPTLPPTETPLPPTATPENSPTPAPPVIRATAKPGLELYAHPEIPDYVFQIDNTRWEADPSEETQNLTHKTINGCRVEPVPPHGLGQPERLLWEDLGRFRWEIMDYGAFAYAVPVLGNGVTQSSAFLHLQGYNNPACRRDHLWILSNLMSRQEAQGQIPYAAFASPTPRPPLEGVSCPNTSTARVRVGDYLAVTTDALWMRSEPRAEESTKVRKFARYAPYMIRVIGGPVCETYLYWQVQVTEFGEGGQSTQGWLAEGDVNEYYIAPVK